jgi:hypothetical protein
VPCQIFSIDGFKLFPPAGMAYSKCTDQRQGHVWRLANSIQIMPESEARRMVTFARSRKAGLLSQSATRDANEACHRDSPAALHVAKREQFLLLGSEEN